MTLEHHIKSFLESNPEMKRFFSENSKSSLRKLVEQMPDLLVNIEAGKNLDDAELSHLSDLASKFADLRSGLSLLQILTTSADPKLFKLPVYPEKSYVPQSIDVANIIHPMKLKLLDLRKDKLSAPQATGIFLLSLSFFSGLINQRTMKSIIQFGVHCRMIDNIIYLVVMKKHKNGAVRQIRIFLDPLSAAIYNKHKAAIDKIMSASKDDLVAAENRRLALNSAFKLIQSSTKLSEFNHALKLDFSLPGFINAINSSRLQTTILPEEYFLLANGYSDEVDEMYSESYTRTDLDEDDSNEDNDLDENHDKFEGSDEPESLSKVSAAVINPELFEEMMSIYEQLFDNNEANNMYVSLLLQLSFYCGMRVGEILSLRFMDIHLVGRPRAIVCKYEDEYLGVKRNFKPKSVSSTRKITLDNLPAKTLELIKHLKKKSDPKGLLMGNASNNLKNIANDRLKSFFKSFRVSPHTCRHSFVNACIALCALFRTELIHAEDFLLPTYLKSLSSIRGFLKSMGFPDSDSMSDFSTVSYAVGHSGPTITAHSYFHISDMVSYVYLLARQSPNYWRAYAYYADVSGRTVSRELVETANFTFPKADSHIYTRLTNINPVKAVVRFKTPVELTNKVMILKSISVDQRLHSHVRSFDPGEWDRFFIGLDVIKRSKLSNAELAALLPRFGEKYLSLNAYPVQQSFIDVFKGTINLDDLKIRRHGVDTSSKDFSTPTSWQQICSGSTVEVRFSEKCKLSLQTFKVALAASQYVLP